MYFDVLSTSVSKGGREENARPTPFDQSVIDSPGRIVVQVLRIIVQMMERRMMGRWRRLMVMKTITQPPTIN